MRTSILAPPALALALAALAVALVPPAARADGCPEGMVGIDDFCIDRWEATIEGQSPFEVPTTAGVAATAPGVVPQGYTSGVVAADSCALAGKRLCTSSEWLRACRGITDRTWPYGDEYVAGACNDTRAVHPVIEVFGAGATFSSEQLNDPALNQLPDSLDPTGANAQCVTPTGVYDLHGNLNEWVADAAGTFRGGYYVEASINGPGCLYVTTAHNTLHHDFSTGFRCCSDDGGGGTLVPVTGERGWVLLPVLLLVGSVVAVGSLRGRASIRG